MKFTINRSNIINVLSHVQGLTSRKSSLAITENILIKSVKSGISIAATDLETGFEGYYKANIEKEGIIAINAKKMFEIVRKFPAEEISVSELENRWIEIGNKNVEYHMVGMNPDDFPNIPQFEDITFFKLESLEFKKMIERTVMITPQIDEKRNHILGIHFECIDSDNEAIIRMVSTDGKRLSKTDYNYINKKRGLPPGENILIPKKGLSEAVKFIETEGTVKVGVKDNHFIIKKNNETIIISLLEGEFPEFNDVLVIDKKTKIKIKKELFKDMLERMSIFYTNEYKGVVFDFNNNTLKINATNPDIGESKEDTEIEFKKESFQVVFNPKYFIETLNAIENDEVFIYVKNEENPCMIHGKDDELFLSIIMPMKI